MDFPEDYPPRDAAWWLEYGQAVHACVVALLSNPNVSLSNRPDKLVDYAAACVQEITDRANNDKKE